MRIYTDPDLVPRSGLHTALLRPVLGATREPPGDPMAGRFDRYDAIAGELFTPTAVEDAEAVVLPVQWEHVEGDDRAVAAARRLARRAAEHGKPLLVFFVSDSTDPVPLEHAIVFRTSLYRSRRREGEFAMPAFVARIGPGSDQAPERPARPKVTFCGNAPHRRAGERTLRSLVSRLRGRDATDGHIRRVACSVLAADPRVDTNFVFRDAFWAGAVRPDGTTDSTRMRVAREEYANNMLSGDYVLCARGGGNFSYRLYEALSAGRTPVFIDTDCGLPFDTVIDWRSLCVWVDESEVASAADKVAEFHAALGGNEGYREQRLRCLETFDHYLSPEGFFRQLATGTWG